MDTNTLHQLANKNALRIVRVTLVMQEPLGELPPEELLELILLANVREEFDSFVQLSIHSILAHLGSNATRTQWRVALVSLHLCCGEITDQCEAKALKGTFDRLVDHGMAIETVLDYVTVAVV